MTNLVGSQTDPGLPTLAAVLDPVELARHLDGLFQWDTSAEIRIDVLRWKKADRCTLEIALKPVGPGQALSRLPLPRPGVSGGQTASGWHELIGKVYAEDRTDVYRTMEEVRLAGFEPDAEFGVPRAVAFLPSLLLLLYEKAPGARARKVIAVGSNGASAAHAAERCGRWLAQFHARGPRTGRVFDAGEQVFALEEARRCLSDCDSQLACKADRLFQQLGGAAQRLGRCDLRASHGTYSPGQVLLTDERTVIIDWDTYQLADPAFDVARFLVELERMGLKYTGSADGFRETAEVFLTAYVAAAGSDVTRRLAFQEAAIFLDRAKHDVDKQQYEKAEVMLDEGVRALAEDRWKSR